MNSELLRHQPIVGGCKTFFDQLRTLGDGQWAIVWHIIKWLTQREMLKFVMATTPAYAGAVCNKNVYSFLQHIPKRMYAMRSLDTALPARERLVLRMDTNSVSLRDNLQARQLDDLADLLPVEVDIYVEDRNSSTNITLTAPSWRVVNLFVTTGATAHVANFKAAACLLFSRAVLAGTDLCPVPQFISQLTACMIDVQHVHIPAGRPCDFDFSVAAKLRMLTVKFPSVKRDSGSPHMRFIDPNDIDLRGARNLKILVYTGSTRFNPTAETTSVLCGDCVPATLDQLTVSNLVVNGNFFAPDKPAKHVQMVRCRFEVGTCIYADRLRIRARSLSSSPTFDVVVRSSTRHATRLQLEGATFTHILSNPFDLSGKGDITMFSRLTVLEFRHVVVSQDLVNASCGGHAVTSLTVDNCHVHKMCQRIVQIPETVQTTFVADSHGGVSVVDIAAVLNKARPHQSMRIAYASWMHAVHGNVVFCGFSLHCTNMTFADTCVLEGKRVVLDNVKSCHMDVSGSAEVVLLGVTPVTFCDLELMPHVFVSINAEAAMQYLTQCLETHSRESIRFMVSIVLDTINLNPLQYYFAALLAATSCDASGHDIDKALRPFCAPLVSRGYTMALHAMYGKRWDMYEDLRQNTGAPCDYRWSPRISYTDVRSGYTETAVLECIAFDKLQMYNRGKRQHLQSVKLCALERENVLLKGLLSRTARAPAQGV